MKVKVVNQNTYPYEEKFRDETVTIPVGGYVVMDKEDAIMFLGQFNSIVRVDGNPHPKSYKRLIIDSTPIVEEKKAK